MKIGQKSLARWMSKLVAQGAGRSTRKPMAAGLRELDAEQLRQVSGGLSEAQLPKTGW
jgi:hypothetical protein